MKYRAQLLLWFLILVHFVPGTKARHHNHLYKKAGVVMWQACPGYSDLVQVQNDHTWKALEILRQDRSVLYADVSIEGTCQ
jgi:hypothetical protein